MYPVKYRDCQTHYFSETIYCQTMISGKKKKMPSIALICGPITISYLFCETIFFWDFWNTNNIFKYLKFWDFSLSFNWIKKLVMIFFILYKNKLKNYILFTRFTIFYVLEIKRILIFFIFFYIYFFFIKFIRLLLKVTEDTTEHQKWHKMSKNCVKNFFFCLGQRPKPSAGAISKLK